MKTIARLLQEQKRIDDRQVEQALNELRQLVDSEQLRKSRARRLVIQLRLRQAAQEAEQKK